MHPSHVCTSKPLGSEAGQLPLMDRTDMARATKFKTTSFFGTPDSQCMREIVRCKIKEKKKEISAKLLPAAAKKMASTVFYRWVVFTVYLFSSVRSVSTRPWRRTVGTLCRVGFGPEDRRVCCFGGNTVGTLCG